jgi:ribosomal protein S18 acetylase RimI-like enzyme
MTVSLSVRRFAAGEWRLYRNLRTRALRDSPDAFGSTLEEALSRPDDAWATRLAAAGDLELPLVAEAEGIPAGLGWGFIDPAARTNAHVFQMWIAPEHRGQGAGGLLLKTIVTWAESMEVATVSLSVTCGNTAATRLYRSAGFEPVGAPQPLRPGSRLLVQPMRRVIGRTTR